MKYRIAYEVTGTFENICNAAFTMAYPRSMNATYAALIFSAYLDADWLVWC